MASLPVLMSMIFALGETAGAVSVAGDMQPKGSEVGSDLVPHMANQEALVTSSSRARGQQGAGWVDVGMTGHTDAVSAQSSFRSLTDRASSDLSQAVSTERSEAQQTSVVRDVAEKLARREYQSLGVSQVEGEQLRHTLDNSLREGSGSSLTTIGGHTSSDSRTSAVGVDASGGASIKGVLGAGVNGSMHASSAAVDENTLLENVQKSSNLDVAKSLSHALSADVGSSRTSNQGQDRSKELSEGKSAADSYVESVSHRASNTSALSHGLQQADSFLAQTQRIGASELAHYAANNDEYKFFQFGEGNRFSESQAARPYLAQAERDMGSLSTDAVMGDARSRQAVQRHMAAVSMAKDPKLPEATRLAATGYLVNEANAMTHGSFQAPDSHSFGELATPAGGPRNDTGVRARGLSSRAGGAVAGLQSWHAQVPTGPSERPGELGAATAANQRLLEGGGVPLSAPSTAQIPTAVGDGLVRAQTEGLGSGDDHLSTAGRAMGGAKEAVNQVLDAAMEGAASHLPGRHSSEKSEKPAPATVSPDEPPVATRPWRRV